MKEIDQNELRYALLRNNSVKNFSIKIEYPVEYDIADIYKSKSINFNNCHIIGKSITFSSFNAETRTSFHFSNCTFENTSITFQKCNIDNIYFEKTNSKTKFSFQETNFNNFTVRGNCSFNFFDFGRSIVFNPFNINGESKIVKLIISNSNFDSTATFNNSQFDEIEISHSRFKSHFNFNHNTINKHLNIDNTHFEYSNFNSNIFLYLGEKVPGLFLTGNKFNGYSSFSDNNSKSGIYIQGCSFIHFVKMDKSSFNHLNINQSIFNAMASFQNTILETIYIDQTSFEKLSFFDNITINNIINCDRKTIRSIKQELQKANNKIDYDVFNALELNSLKEELRLKKKFWYNDKDAFIISLTYLFSNNGMSWTKALLVTIIGSFLFYSVFYWGFITNFNFRDIDFDKKSHFFNGLTSFLIPTNIYNPLIPKEYVSGFSWIPFILGKIFLSIGIYEIINSFRKFKN